MAETRPGDSAASGLLSAFLFILSVAAIFISLGWYVTDLQGGAVSSVGSGVDPERGETLFWGDGTCHTCHSISDRGNMKRCPNLGEGEEGEPIGIRAAERAAERADATGAPYSALDYIVESIATPGDYVVEGFPDKLMPLVYTGQIDLEPDDVMSIVAYLMSLSGEVDLEQIAQSMGRYGQPILNKSRLADQGPAVRKITLPNPEWEIIYPEQMAEYAELVGEQALAEYRDEHFDEEQKEIYDEIVEEWMDEGREVFGDRKCWQCHMIAGEDFGAVEAGKVGPDLSSIGAIQPPEYIMESILTPDAMIVPPLAENAVDGRSKMPSYVDQIDVYRLLRLVFYLAEQKGAAATDTTTSSGSAE